MIIRLNIRTLLILVFWALLTCQVQAKDYLCMKNGIVAPSTKLKSDCIENHASQKNTNQYHYFLQQKLIKEHQKLTQLQQSLQHTPNTDSDRVYNIQNDILEHKNNILALQRELSWFDWIEYLDHSEPKIPPTYSLIESHHEVA